VLWLATKTAHAAELDWRAPERCPDAEELRFRVERAIAMPLSHAAPLRFLVTAEPSGQGFAARIDVITEDGSGERQRALSASDCSELADMVTVAVALALGAAPNGSEDSAAPRAAELAATPPERAAPEAPRDPSGDGSPADPAKGASTGDGASQRWRPGLSVWLLADSGSLPTAGPGAALGVQLEHPPLQIRAVGTALYAQHASLAPVAGQSPGADLALWTAALGACAVPLGTPGESLEGHVCAG
jgi:hypothetical protein